MLSYISLKCLNSSHQHPSKFKLQGFVQYSYGLVRKLSWQQKKTMKVVLEVFIFMNISIDQLWIE